MKIIKKLGIALMFSALPMLAGCDIFGLLKTQREEASIDVNKKGEVYYVQYNISSTSLANPTIPRDKYGTVISASARNAVEEDIKNAEKMTTDPNGLMLFNDTSAIRQLENDCIKELNKIESRAASNRKSVSLVTDNFAVGNTRDFWIWVRTSQGDVMQKRTAECKYKGKYCYVWFIDNNKATYKKTYNNTEDFKNLADKFDTLYPLEVAVVGSNNDYRECASYYRAPHDKVHILLHDIFEDASNDQTVGVMGYATSIDLYTEDALRQSNSNNHSNELDVLYVDSHFYSFDGTETSWNPKGWESRGQIYSTLPHEYNHFINYVQKFVVNDLSDMQTWYTEMLSTVVEDLLMETLDIDWTLSARGRLNVFDYYYNYGFELWEPSDGNVLFNYANTFAYGAFLARNFGGEALIHEIATNNKLNAESINAALAKMKLEGKISTTETYKSTLKKFVNVLINTDEQSATSSVLTLNKPAATYTSGISIKPINLVFKNTDGSIAFQPQFVNYSKYDGYSGYITNYGYNNSKLYPGAFVVDYVGKNVSSFTIYKPNQVYEKYIDSEVIIK